MKANSLFFSAPYQVEVREHLLPKMEGNQVLVKSIFSVISPGTEMLIYQGKFPQSFNNNADKYVDNLTYPFKFGYACVGQVIELGSTVKKIWQDKLVFAFQPHGSHFISEPDALYPLPEDCSPESACFLASMETSINLVQDSAPILGECVMIFGQGIVGLLTAALLVEFPLQTLLTADRYMMRRNASLEIGVNASFDPDMSEYSKRVVELLPRGADLTLELSGSPHALNDAISITGFGGRIVIGSWYGERQARIKLGGKFHRSRQRIISSQVSTISAALSDRWDKSRRFDIAWTAINRIHPERWITHRFKLEEATQAYRMLDHCPDETIQLIFDYS